MSALIPPPTNSQTSSTPTTSQQPQQKHGNTLTPPISSGASGAGTITKSSPMTSLRSSEAAPSIGGSNSMMHRNSSFAGSTIGMIPSSPYAHSQHSTSNNYATSNNTRSQIPADDAYPRRALPKYFFHPTRPHVGSNFYTKRLQKADKTTMLNAHDATG